MTLSRTAFFRQVDNCVVFRLWQCCDNRKNFLFLGSDNGGDRAATLYSLLGTAKLNHINAEKYLSHVLSVIADYKVTKVGELLPWNVKLSSIAQSADEPKPIAQELPAPETIAG